MNSFKTLKICFFLKRISSSDKRKSLIKGRKSTVEDQDIPLAQHHESKEGLSRTINSGNQNRVSSGRMVDLSNADNVNILSKSINIELFYY